MINMVKLPTSKSELFLRVAKGHFATSHSHINYYIDVTTQKTRLSEAKAVAKELVSAYQHSTIVDTVLCLDGTQVIGTCLANELTKDGFTNMNAHKTIYIVTPEYTSGSQIIQIRMHRISSIQRIFPDHRICGKDCHFIFLQSESSAIFPYTCGKQYIFTLCMQLFEYRTFQHVFR